VHSTQHAARSTQRNAKNAFKKYRRGQMTRGKDFPPSAFWQKKNVMYFFQKSFCGVFELPLLRNAQKRH
jgi:hypothetical protein